MFESSVFSTHSPVSSSSFPFKAKTGGSLGAGRRGKERGGGRESWNLIDSESPDTPHPVRRWTCEAEIKAQRKEEESCQFPDFFCFLFFLRKFCFSFVQKGNFLWRWRKPALHLLLCFLPPRNGPAGRDLPELILRVRSPPPAAAYILGRAKSSKLAGFFSDALSLPYTSGSMGL